MTFKLTRAELTALGPCDLDAALALFGRRESVTARQALDAGATVSDLLWVLGALGRGDLCARFAIGEARAVAHLNSNPRVMAAIVAAERCLDDPSEENRDAAADAAWAAASEAAASTAARAAARAARAAGWAARAAAGGLGGRARLEALGAAWAAEAAGVTKDDQKERFLAIVEALDGPEIGPEETK